MPNASDHVKLDVVLLLTFPPRKASEMMKQHFVGNKADATAADVGEAMWKVASVDDCVGENGWMFDPRNFCAIWNETTMQCQPGCIIYFPSAVIHATLCYHFCHPSAMIHATLCYHLCHPSAVIHATLCYHLCHPSAVIHTAL